MLKVKALRNDIDAVIDGRGRSGKFKLGGFNNLTRSDLDMLKVACDYYEKYGGSRMVSYFSGKVYMVLKKYGL